MRDITKRREVLLGLGQNTADGLTHFVNLQNSAHKRRTKDFNATGFQNQISEGIKTKEYFQSLTQELVELSKSPPSSSIEGDYINILGTYLCDLVECVTAYIEYCHAFSKFDSSRRIRTIIPIFKTRSKFKKMEKKYLTTGIDLSALWPIYKYADEDN